ncbi:hypothetical protein ACOZ38_25405 [Sphaerisporangium viridialbum]|uniref:hypothetical protein n=1 Tax=Sphaerisporangium viridialbum TaxID=46189 RepID=UPI003C7762E0
MGCTELTCPHHGADNRAALTRVDARHQPTTVDKWVPCKEHVNYWVVMSCAMCAVRPVQECTNTTCQTWPCADHLAIHGETTATCVHTGGTV